MNSSAMEPCRMTLCGLSRSRVAADHALITPESHVPLLVPGWYEAEVNCLISREMGAKFAQYLVHTGPSSQLVRTRNGYQYLVLVIDGSINVIIGDHSQPVASNGYAYLSPGVDFKLLGKTAATLLIFEKHYAAIAGLHSPDSFVRTLGDVPPEPFLGDEGALLQCLLPADPQWDWAINVFEFVPGATLPQVESHFMEHGLYFLAGQGVYRLGDNWYTVQHGDAIWMAPYLLQWFAATGKSPAKYIYYKEMNRAPAC